MLLFGNLLSGNVYAGFDVSRQVGRQVGRQVTRQVNAAISKNLNANLIIPKLKIRDAAGAINDSALTADGKILSLLHGDDSVRVWDLDIGIQRPMLLLDDTGMTSVVSASSSGLSLVGREDGKISVFETLTGRQQKLLNNGNVEVVLLVLSSDERLLAAIDASGNITIWDIATLTVRQRLQTSRGDAITAAAFAANGNALLVAGEDGFVEQWDLTTGTRNTKLPAMDEDVIAVWFIAETMLIVTADADGVLQGVDARTGKRLWLHKPDDDVKTQGIDKHAALAALASDDHRIKIVRIGDWHVVRQWRVQKDIRRLQFINSGRQLAGADAQGIVHLWHVASGREILRLIATGAGWTVVDNQGRFDSDEAGMSKVSWEAADKDIPIDNFSEKYYEPGLLGSHLQKGKFINQHPVQIQAGITLPPEVQVFAGDSQKKTAGLVQVIVEIVDAGGGIGDVQVYHNGKVIDRSRASKKVEKMPDGGIRQMLRLEISPTAGHNIIRALASNSMGIASLPATLTFESGGRKILPTLHVLSVGIDQYQDRQLNLDYSVADARSIANILSDSRFSAFHRVKQYNLYDRQATKQAILTKLQQIAEFNHNDVMVMYLAGHGIALNGEWYFLPHETTLQADRNYYKKVGISAREIQKLLEKIKIQRILVMVDACYSGAGLKAFRKLQNTQRHFTRALSKQVGIVVLAATRQDQEAVELADLGHGLFTYVVEQGMQGKADMSPRNNQISAHEVAMFSRMTIPEFARKYLGASQEPTAFTMGSDFTLLQPKR